PDHDELELPDETERVLVHPGHEEDEEEGDESAQEREGIGHGYHDLAERPYVPPVRARGRVSFLISGRASTGPAGGTGITVPGIAFYAPVASFPGPALEELLHPVGDQRQGDEFSAGREREEHCPRGGGKDVPVAERGETGDQQGHDNEAEQDRGSREGDDEDLEVQEIPEGQGPGRHR